jgi:hypothetical protein
MNLRETIENLDIAMIVADEIDGDDEADIEEILTDWLCANTYRPYLDFFDLPTTDDWQFLNSLDAANNSRGSQSADWEVVEEKENGGLLRRDGIYLRAKSKEYRIDPDTGKAIVLFPNYSMDVETYMAIGEAGIPSTPHRCHLYWHVDAAESISLTQSICQEFNRAAIPFQWRVQSHPDRLGLPASSILTLDRDRWQQLAALLPKLLTCLKAGVPRRIPLLTKPIAAGVGLAEVPNDAEESANAFILARYPLIAAGLAETIDLPSSRRWQAIAAQFKEAGLNLDRPYLNANSTDSYDLDSIGG